MTSMEAMFKHAQAFNHDVSSFSVSQVHDMSGMFAGASSFSQNLTAWSGALQKGTIVTHMFNGTACPNQHDPQLKVLPQGPFCYTV
jgi:hypothetical protein